MGFLHGLDNGHFCFMDDDGNCIPNHKLFGKTTTFPYYYNGFTRERDGHTYWLIRVTCVDMLDVTPYDNYMLWDDEDGPLTKRIHSMLHPDLPFMNKYIVELGTTARNKATLEASMKAIEERVWIPINFLTDEECTRSGLYWFRKGHFTKTNEAGAVAIRDDSLAWDVYLGISYSPRMPIPYKGSSVKSWDDKIDHYLYVTLPEREEQKKRIAANREAARKKWIDLEEVPVPKMKLGRGADNSGVAYAKAINALIHNAEALKLMDEALLEMIKQETGEYGGNIVKVWIEPENIVCNDTAIFGIYLDTAEIPVRTFDIRVDYPQGFDVTSWNEHVDVIPGALQIEKTSKGVLMIAQAGTRESTPAPISGRIYDVTLKNIGAVPGAYEMPIITAQFVDENGKMIEQKIETIGATVTVN